MAFLDKDTLVSLEGKYLSFQDGVVRELRLVTHRAEQRTSKKGTQYTANLLTVIDCKSGDEKEINADGKFMTKLAKINHLLSEGATVYVKPVLIGTTPQGYEKFDYEIQLEPFQE